VRLEESIAWRRLTKTQQHDIASRLKLFARQRAFSWYNGSDIEGGTFALDIMLALKQAGWIVSEPQPIMKMKEGPVAIGENGPMFNTGVVISSTTDERSHSAAESVSRELTALGFDSVTKDDTRKLSPFVSVGVEPRPSGPQGKAKLKAQKMQAKSQAEDATGPK